MAVASALTYWPAGQDALDRFQSSIKAQPGAVWGALAGAAIAGLFASWFRRKSKEATKEEQPEKLYFSPSFLSLI